MDWSRFAGMMPDGSRITKLANMAQTVGQIAGVAQRFIETSNTGNVSSTIEPAKTELQFVEPLISGSSSQNLFDGFSRDFLKSLMSVGCADNEALVRALLEERRADRDGCTPLLCAVKRNDLDAALLLLAYGANPHQADANGDTPLHHAVMAGSVPIVKLLLCFGANLDKPNNSGQTANSMQIKNQRLTDVLCHARAWTQSDVCSPARSGINTKDSVKACDKALERVTHEQQQRALLERRHQCLAATPQSIGGVRNGAALRLLSLDGGGIRGLVLIQILLELESLVDGGTSQQQQKRPEKHNFVQRHFDWIAGTSTGAILALALADGTPLVDCLRLYLRLKDDIFGPQAKASRLGGYKPECIEKFLQQHFGKQRKMAELRCGNDTKVFVTATKAEQCPIELVLFRNYDSPFTDCAKHVPNAVRVWQAARYSSAAPTYFPSMDGLMDGGLIANNPSNELLREVYLHSEAAKLNITGAQEEHQIAFMLSLGTGKTPPVSMDSIDLVLEPNFSTILQSLTALSNLKSILVEQLATSDGQVVESARMLCHLQKVPFFRLTPQLRVDIPLDTVDNGTLIDMLWDTKVYVREQCAEDVLALVELMREYDHCAQ